MTYKKIMLLKEALPELADEIKILLIQDKHIDLANQIETITIHKKCGCGDSFCSSLYTAKPPKGAWGPNHETIVLDAKSGMLNLDVVDGIISYIEIIDRKDLKKKIKKLRI